MLKVANDAVFIKDGKEFTIPASKIIIGYGGEDANGRKQYIVTIYDGETVALVFGGATSGQMVSVEDIIPTPGYQVLTPPRIVSTDDDPQPQGNSANPDPEGRDAKVEPGPQNPPNPDENGRG